MISYAEQLYDEITAEAGGMNKDTTRFLVDKLQKVPTIHVKGSCAEPRLAPVAGVNTADAIYEIDYLFLDGSKLTYKVAPDHQEPVFTVSKC